MFKSMWSWIVNRIFQVTRYKVGYALGYTPENPDELGLVVYVEAVALGGIPFQVCLDHDAIDNMAEWVKNKDQLIAELKAEEGYEA